MSDHSKGSDISLRTLLKDTISKLAGFIYPHLACLHDQNKSGFFGGQAFFHPIRAFENFYCSDWLEKATFVLIM